MGVLDHILGAVRRRYFSVVGLTAGSNRQLASLKATIAAIRIQSMNRLVGVMVGGPMFTADPAVAADVGANATAPNAPVAVLTAQKLFDLAAARNRASQTG